MGEGVENKQCPIQEIWPFPIYLVIKMEGKVESLLRRNPRLSEKKIEES
jgi:hypothetical protein